MAIKRPYKVISCVVMAALLVSLNKETAFMLVSPTNPLRIELYSYANAFFIVLVEKHSH